MTFKIGSLDSPLDVVPLLAMHARCVDRDFHETLSKGPGSAVPSRGSMAGPYAKWTISRVHPTSRDDYFGVMDKRT